MKKTFAFRLVFVLLILTSFVKESFSQISTDNNFKAYQIKIDESLNSESFLDLEERVLTKDIFFFIFQGKKTDRVIILSNSKNPISLQDLRIVFNRDIKILNTRDVNASLLDLSALPIYKEADEYNTYINNMNNWKNQNPTFIQDLKSSLQ